jgi:hypothetical protein
VLTCCSIVSLILSDNNELHFRIGAESVNAASCMVNVIIDESLSIICWKSFNLEGFFFLAVIRVFMGKLLFWKCMGHYQQFMYYR